MGHSNEIIYNFSPHTFKQKNKIVTWGGTHSKGTNKHNLGTYIYL